MLLVTGGAGYIGSHVVKELLETSTDEIIVVDNLSTGFLQTIETLLSIDGDKKLKFYNYDLGDFSKMEELFAKNKITKIIHFAAFSIVSESMVNPLKYYTNNTLNGANLISLSIKYGVKKFIFSSTAAVYGEPKADEIPICESTKTEPINPYGSSKLFLEKIIQDAALANKEFKFVILRYFNVCGADGLIGECHEPETHLIPLVVKTALGKRGEIVIFGDDYETPDGTNIRDYIHVKDLSHAHIKALEYLKENDSGIFNCGYGHGYSVKEIIQTVKKVSKSDFKVSLGLRRDGDPAILIADNSKIKKLMNWEAKHDNLELICLSALEWEKRRA